MMNINKLTFVSILITVLNFVGSNSLSAQVVWLDELDLSTATQGYGVIL